MECTCGSTREPWAEAVLTIPAPLSETVEEGLFELLGGVRGVRGVRIDVEVGKVLVSYDPAFVTIDRLRKTTEGAGVAVGAVSSLETSESH